MDDEHFSWISEGVSSWNQRRLSQQFKPDLSGGDFNSIALEGADLREADLSEARFGEWAQGEAIAEASDLRGANLSGASMSVCYLHLVDVADALFDRIDVRSRFFGKGDNPTFRGIHKEESDYWHTDLSTLQNLSQEQLNAMIGDSGVLLPDHLERPSHWEEVESGDTEFTPVQESEGRALGGSQTSSLRASSVNETVLLSGQAFLDNVRTVRLSLERMHNEFTSDELVELKTNLDALEREVLLLGSQAQQLGDVGNQLDHLAAQAKDGFLPSFKRTIENLTNRERLGEVAGLSSLVLAGASFGSAVGLAASALVTGPAYPLVIAGGALGTKIAGILVSEGKASNVLSKELDSAAETDRDLT